MANKFDLSPTSKFRVYLLTALGTLLCIVLAFAIDSYSFKTGDWQLQESGINNLIIPLAVAPPFFIFLLSKLRELSMAHQELQALAATDSLTNCLNRRAFTAMVEGYLDRLEKMRDREGGALLVLDVDHFKAVNDRFGHDNGDEALKLIADAIKANVRERDLVARLGGEEFGVFLPGLDPVRTRHIAERICVAVRDLRFAPEGTPHLLSISIGGVTYIPPTNFSELYRNADRQLYAAKNAGRDRIDIVMGNGPVQPAVTLM